jgi:lipopolysaccharide exporter
MWNQGWQWALTKAEREMRMLLADRARKHLEPLWSILPGKAGFGFEWTQIRALSKRDPSIIIGTLLAQNLLRLISTLILTRLLAPADFGILGMISVVHYTINMLFDVGTDTFIVRHRDIEDRRFLDVVWTVRVARTLLSAAIIAVFAGLFSRLLGNNSLTGVLVVSALGLVAAAPQSLSLSIATRNKQLVLISSIDVFLAVLTLIVTVGFAFIFRNYWAAVISSIVGYGIRSLLSYLLFPSPVYRFAFDKKIVAEMWRFSRFVAGSSLITLFLSQIDKVVLGHFLSLEDFGTYILAVSLASVPQIFCSMYGQRVLFPTYTQAYRDDPNSMRRVFHQKLSRVGPLYCFAVGGLISFAPVLIAMMYQDRYAQAAYYVALLSIPSFFALSSVAATEALIAVGEVRATYHANLVRLGWLFPATGLAVYSGRTDAILVAIAFSELPATIYTWWKLRQHGVLSLRRELPTFLFGVLGIVVGWGAYQTIGLFFHIKPIGLFG